MSKILEIKEIKSKDLVWMIDHLPFNELDANEFNLILPHLNCIEYEAGEEILEGGAITTSAYFVTSGSLSLSQFNRITQHFGKGDFFGEISLIDQKPRTGTIVAEEISILVELKKEALDKISKSNPSISQKIYKGLALFLTGHIRRSFSLYQNIDVLLIQDGGCAPGYNPVTAFITEYLEKIGRKVFITDEGFKSIVCDQSDDYRCLISDEYEFRQLEHIPGVIDSSGLRDARGAAFRSERYPEFKSPELQKQAAQNLINRNVKCIVGIGGDGTFKGIKSLCQYLPDSIQAFFIPVTIDSDIIGTDCIGEYTGVEIGAEKIRCYLADAHTHKRCYLIEMMGADAGFHALHSCLGAGADLAVLPNSEYNIPEIARAIQNKQGVVIVVAQGYNKKNRQDQDYPGNAAEFFRDQLQQSGVRFNQRLICESFSRDIRGAAPNNLDITLSQRLARKLTQLILAGQSKQMPAVLSGKEYSISFDKIETSNCVEPDLAVLANKLTK